jgi:hypothetical protein
MSGTFTPKQPYEEYYVSFNFTVPLGVETIASATITAVDETTLEDVSTVILDVAKQSISNPLVYAWVRAGETGHSYLVTCRITGSLGSQYELEGLLQVIELPSAPIPAQGIVSAALSSILHDPAFQVAATIGAVIVYGNFENKFIAVDGIETKDPTFEALDTDLAGVLHGSTIVINAISYTVAGIEPNGWGSTILYLRKI